MGDDDSIYNISSEAVCYNSLAGSTGDASDLFDIVPAESTSPAIPSGGILSGLDAVDTTTDVIQNLVEKISILEDKIKRLEGLLAEHIKKFEDFSAEF